MSAPSRARIGSFLPTLVAFAAAPCDDIDQIIVAVIVGNLGACSDVLDGAYDNLVAYRVDLGIGSARMIHVASECSFGSFRRLSNGG